MQTELLGPWRPYLEHSMQKPYFPRLAGLVDAAYAAGETYPPEGDLFRAFSLCPPERVRAVILGQDPYHEPEQAMGLAFSVPDGVPLPPSLRNIYKELALDLGADHRLQAGHHVGIGVGPHGRADDVVGV